MNDFLLDGPPLACDIRGVIMRFRDSGEVAVAADIKDFFHEVYVDERDAAAFRYFWFINGEMKEVKRSSWVTCSGRRIQDAWQHSRCAIT